MDENSNTQLVPAWRRNFFFFHDTLRPQKPCGLLGMGTQRPSSFMLHNLCLGRASARVLHHRLSTEGYVVVRDCQAERFLKVLTLSDRGGDMRANTSLQNPRESPTRSYSVTHQSVCAQEAREEIELNDQGRLSRCYDVTHQSVYAQEAREKN